MSITNATTALPPKPKRPVSVIHSQFRRVTVSRVIEILRQHERYKCDILKLAQMLYGWFRIRQTGSYARIALCIQLTLRRTAK